MSFVLGELMFKKLGKYDSFGVFCEGIETEGGGDKN